MPKVPEDGKGRKSVVAAKPRFVNRGAAGLLNKVTEKDRAGLVLPALPAPSAVRREAVHRVAPALRDMAVPISGLIPDPENARLHPERNMEAIKASLRLYGQVKPIVVRRSTNVVIAGNGTLAAARAMGWTELAATFVDMTDAEAAGYGLADNRTAELAAWDEKTVGRLERLMRAAGQESIGWTQDELDVLMAESWIAPPPEQFPEVDETIEVEHMCPRCNYRFSGGEKVKAGDKNGEDDAQDS